MTNQVQPMPDMTKRARRIIGHSYLIAQELQAKAVGSEHLLLSLAIDEHSVAARTLKALGISADQVGKTIAELTREKATSPDNPDLHP